MELFAEGTWNAVKRRDGWEQAAQERVYGELEYENTAGVDSASRSSHGGYTDAQKARVALGGATIDCDRSVCGAHDEIVRNQH